MEYYVKLDASDIIYATEGLEETRDVYLAEVIEQEIDRIMDMRRIYDRKLSLCGRPPTREEAVILLDRPEPFAGKTPRDICISHVDSRFGKILELRKNVMVIGDVCPSIRLTGGLYTLYLELTENSKC